MPKFYAIDLLHLPVYSYVYLIISLISCFRVTTPLRDYTKIEEQNCQLVTDYRGKKFNGLRSIAVGPNDEVVVLDDNNKEVIIFDKDLNLILTFGQGSGDSELNDPAGVAISHNVIAVSEWDDHVVKKFSLQGDYLSKFGSYGSGDGQFNNPQGLCFNSKGLLYVVDHNNHRVQVFRENVFLFKFGSKGPNPGQFKDPSCIAVDSSDQVYVTDYDNYDEDDYDDDDYDEDDYDEDDHDEDDYDDDDYDDHDYDEDDHDEDEDEDDYDEDDDGISVFSEDGHFIKKINCNNPLAICISPDDYVISDAEDFLIVFSPTHDLIAKFGTRGNAKGQFRGINDIAINSSGTIFVTEHNNKRLQIIATLEH